MQNIQIQNGVNANINKITKEINQLELQKNSVQLNNKGIISAMQVINRMQGYDLTKQEEEENNDKVEQLRNELSIEELRQLAYKKESKDE